MIRGERPPVPWYDLRRARRSESQRQYSVLASERRRETLRFMWQHFKTLYAIDPHEVDSLPHYELEAPGNCVGHRDGDEKTLQEIADELGMSRERVRQIEASALRKLRNSVLREFV